MKTQGSLTPALMREAEVHLCQSDPIMADLIEQHGPCSLPERPFEPFHTLTTSIISQQLSAKAADTIERRVAQLVPSPFLPVDMLRVSTEQLRAVGLSLRKAAYIHELAGRVIDGRLSFEALASTDDESVIAALVEIPGIGRWTAEMFLIFGLKRPNVLALDDVGLQRAVRLLYGDCCALAHLSPAWRPFSTVASWYLWRHLDS